MENTLPAAPPNRAAAFERFEEASAYHTQGNLSKAAECYLEALRLCPEFPEALNNLGALVQSRGDFAAAEKLFRSAVALKPDYVYAHNNLGNVLRYQSRLAGAEASYRQALTIDPAYAQGYLNLGHVLLLQGYPKGAGQCYRNVIFFKGPEMLEAYGYLCNMLEKTNQTDNLRACLDELSEEQILSTPEIALAKAKLLRRNHQLEQAATLLRGFDPLAFSENSVVCDFLAVRGDLHDRMGEYALAYDCFEKSNQLAMRLFAWRNVDKNEFLSGLKAAAAQYVEQRVATWTHPQYSPRRLAFIVGFPRSGTTLLDTILRSHPEVVVIEELPLIARVLDEVNRREKIEPGFIGRLDDKELATLRDMYLSELTPHLDPKRPDALVIDKVPLNLVNVGLIYRLFPEARFILALRDPRDCVLSCFMQPFEPNSAMANFLTLEDAAAFYDNVMRLWCQYEAVLPLRAQKIRYEDIVSDFSAAVGSVLEFLGLPWDDAVSKYQETALKRDIIRTPSYHQVVQPIYKRASGRWIKYEPQMRPVLPILHPWVKAFGYED